MLMRAELDRLATEPVPAGELTSRTSTLTGEYGRSLETNDGLASHLSSWAVQDVPLTALQNFIPDVLAVKADAVQKFAGEHLRSAETCVVIAGQAESLRAALGEAFKDAEIIPQQALDLDALSLRGPVKGARKK